MKRRVKINKLPKNYMQDGGPVSKTLGAVPREFANLEAEKGEVIATQDKGDLALFTIGGKRHSEGGTPMRRPAGDFIWSDTKKMKIKDEDILKEFGASKAATPAKLAKKFLDTNDYRAILDDPKSDDMAKKTAAMMLEKNKEKLARLAFVQEEMKGFPQGIPGIAQDYAASIGVPMAQYGGAMLPKAQDGLSVAEREQRLRSLEAQRRQVSANPNLGEFAKGRQMTELNRAIALEQQYIDKMSREKAPIPIPQASTSSAQSVFAPSYSTPDNPVIYKEPVQNEYLPFPEDTGGLPLMYDNPSEGNTTAQGSQSSSASRPSGSQSSSSTGRTLADSRKYGNIELYEGSRQNTPTDKSNRFDYSEQEFFNDWESVIPGIKDMTNEQAQAAAYEYMLANNPDQLATMWNEFGLTKKGLRNEALAARYPDGRIPSDLTEADLKELEDAYVDGFFGARQMRPPVEEPKLPVKEIPQIRETEEDMVIPEVRKFDPRETKPFEQDLRNERVLARNRLSERKRYPWRGRLAGRAADPLYQSDVNQQQNIQAQQAIASAAAASFADPNALMANLSRLSGLTGDTSNQIAAQIQRENTNIGNQFERFNTELAGQTDIRNLANTQDLYDMTVKTDEVFDEKMRNYNVAQGRQRNITDTNLARAKAMNKLNPLWTINTGEGPQFGDIQFQPGVSTAMFQPGQASASEQQKAYIAAQRQAIQDDLTLTPEDRSKLMGKLYEQELGLLNPKSTGNISPEQAAAMYQYQQMMGTVGIPQSTYAGYQTPSMRMGGESKRKKRY